MWKQDSQYWSRVRHTLSTTGLGRFRDLPPQEPPSLLPTEVGQQPATGPYRRTQTSSSKATPTGQPRFLSLRPRRTRRTRLTTWPLWQRMTQPSQRPRSDLDPAPSSTPNSTNNSGPSRYLTKAIAYGDAPRSVLNMCLN